MLRARLNDMTRERVRLSKTSTTLAIFDRQTPCPPKGLVISRCTSSCYVRAFYGEQDSLLRMLGEERSHVTELERIIEAARAR